MDRTEGEEAVEIPVAGVCALSHTADVAIEVSAPSLPELFRRAALGTLWMVYEEVPSDHSGGRLLRVAAEDEQGLLRAWLREVLYWEEVEDFVVAEITDLTVREGVAQGETRGGVPPARAVREIKGVTWHGLMVEERPDGWVARVIFDV